MCKFFSGAKCRKFFLGSEESPKSQFIHFFFYKKKTAKTFTKQQNIHHFIFPGAKPDYFFCSRGLSDLPPPPSEKGGAPAKPPLIWRLLIPGGFKKKLPVTLWDLRAVGRKCEENGKNISVPSLASCRSTLEGDLGQKTASEEKKTVTFPPRKWASNAPGH